MILTPNRWKEPVFSPNHPSAYPDFLDCYFAFVSATGDQIVLEFSTFILENETKFEKIFEKIFKKNLTFSNFFFQLQLRLFGNLGRRQFWKSPKILRRLDAKNKIASKSDRPRACIFASGQRSFQGIYWFLRYSLVAQKTPRLVKYCETRALYCIHNKSGFTIHNKNGFAIHNKSGFTIQNKNGFTIQDPKNLCFCTVVPIQCIFLWISLSFAIENRIQNLL